jgi:hypothetical protein
MASSKMYGLVMRGGAAERSKMLFPLDFDGSYGKVRTLNQE